MHRAHLSESSSTMDEAKRCLADHEKVFITAQSQQQGRGQRGSVWLSPIGGLYCTYGQKFTSKNTSLGGLSLAVGVCLIEALKLDDLGISLKWPNDLVDATTKKKLAGILIETSLCGEAVEVLIGIGLNVEKTDPKGRIAATSLEELLSPTVSIPSLEATAVIVGSALEQCTQQFLQHGFLPWKGRFLALCAFTNSGRNETVQAVVGDGQTVQGHFLGISDDGALILQDEYGIHTIVSGHITKW